MSEKEKNLGEKVVEKAALTATGVLVGGVALAIVGFIFAGPVGAAAGAKMGAAIGGAATGGDGGSA